MNGWLPLLLVGISILLSVILLFKVSALETKINVFLSPSFVTSADISRYDLEIEGDGMAKGAAMPGKGAQWSKEDPKPPKDNGGVTHLTAEHDARILEEDD